MLGDKENTPMKITITDGDMLSFGCNACQEPAVRLTRDSHARWTGWCANHQPRTAPVAALPARHIRSLSALLTVAETYSRRRR